MNDMTCLSGSGRIGIYLVVLAVSAASVAWASSDGASLNEKRFFKENDAAMAIMMKNMDASPSGDIDRDFATMMIPHHQGAIDMAQSELRYGRNETLRRLAQEIVVDQAQEIAVMNAQLARLPSPAMTKPKPESDSDAPPPAMHGMRRTM